MKSKFTILALAFTFISANAQENRVITGYVYDASQNNTPLSYAVVSTNNNDYAVETDDNGYFMLEVPNQEYTLIASYYGFQTKETTCSLNVNKMNFSLEPEELNLDEIVISHTRNKNTEAAILDTQRKSLEFKQEIGVQELSRKGVSNVAGAVVKTSGVTKQESTGGIFVRGLGDRYNSTFLNGLPVVSNDPEKKNIDLNIFSTDVVDKISIDKTFLTRYSGDFGGASIDISSKTLQGNPYFSIEIGGNANTNSLSQSQFFLPSNRNSLGFNTSNQVPTIIPNQYFFTNTLNSKIVSPFGGAFALNGGTNWQVGNNGKLSLVGAFSFENAYQYKEGIDKQVNAQGVRLNDYFVKRFGYNTKSSGTVHIDYDWNENNSISYALLGVNDSFLNYDHYQGYMRDKAEIDNGGIVQRNTYIQNSLIANQLLGKHQLNEKNSFNWGISYNNVTSSMPDRTQTSVKFDETLNGYRFITNSSSDNHRYFHGLNEDELALNLTFNHKFLKDTENNSYKANLIFGYDSRIKNREFKANQYNFDIASSERNVLRNPYNLDEFFNAENYQNNKFEISTFRGNGTNSGEPQFYNGEMIIHSGFVNLEYQLSSKLYSVIGMRYENISQNVDWKTQLDDNGNSSKLNKHAFLPSVNLKYEVNPIQNIRLAASKTYTLPQFKERAPFIYEDVTEIKFGNKDLYASDNYNLDLKWEYFPNNDEIISATVFGKYIQNPINETNIASSTNDISYVNTGDYGYVAGIEVELRKNLIYFSNNLDNKLSLGFNASYMHTEQELNSEKIANETNFSGNFTHNKSAFTGAPSFLGNVDLTYSTKFDSDSGLIATIAYYHSSDKIYALGIENKGNLIDKGFGMLDFVLKADINKNISLGLQAKNLLNPAVERIQENINENILVRSYKLGTNISLSAQYKF